MKLSRREFLAGSVGIPAFSILPGTSSAQSDNYKALVHVYLSGGNDGLNTLIPLDPTQYDIYRRSRPRLALPRGTDPRTCIAELPGADHGLHPAMRPLLEAWNAKNLAFVHNVGTLRRPITQAEFFAWQAVSDWRQLPQALSSHSDQMLLWENGSHVVGRNFGWGGMAVAQIPGSPPVVSLAGNTRFASSEIGGALALHSSGQLGIYSRVATGTGQQIVTGLSRDVSNSVFANIYAEKQLAGYDLAARISPIGAMSTTDARLPAGFGAAFGDISQSSFSKQLFMVAKLINARSVLGGQRHIFHVSLGGFDLHGGQVGTNPHEGNHAYLLSELAAGLVRFRRAMLAIGLDANVTTFTTSEFGRTVLSNSSLGTDHGWGSSQLIMGGAVVGGRLYGDAPNLLPGGPTDAGVMPGVGQGRFIPSCSVEQYAVPFLRWLEPGLTLSPIFPNHANFALDKLKFFGV